MKIHQVVFIFIRSWVKNIIPRFHSIHSSHILFDHKPPLPDPQLYVRVSVCGDRHAPIDWVDSWPRVPNSDLRLANCSLIVWGYLYLYTRDISHWSYFCDTITFTINLNFYLAGDAVICFCETTQRSLDCSYLIIVKTFLYLHFFWTVIYSVQYLDNF